MPPHKQRKDEYSRFLFLMGKFSFATKSNAKVLNDLTVLKLRRGPPLSGEILPCYQG